MSGLPYLIGDNTEYFLFEYFQHTITCTTLLPAMRTEISYKILTAEWRTPYESWLVAQLYTIVAHVALSFIAV